MNWSRGAQPQEQAECKTWRHGISGYAKEPQHRIRPVPEAARPLDQFITPSSMDRVYAASFGAIT